MERVPGLFLDSHKRHKKARYEVKEKKRDEAPPGVCRQRTIHTDMIVVGFKGASRRHHRPIGEQGPASKNRWTLLSRQSASPRLVTGTGIPASWSSNTDAGSRVYREARRQGQPFTIAPHQLNLRRSWEIPYAFLTRAGTTVSSHCTVLWLLLGTKKSLQGAPLWLVLGWTTISCMHGTANRQAASQLLRLIVEEFADALFRAVLQPWQLRLCMVGVASRDTANKSVDCCQ